MGRGPWKSVLPALFFCILALKNKVYYKNGEKKQPIDTDIYDLKIKVILSQAHTPPLPPTVIGTDSVTSSAYRYMTSGNSVNLSVLQFPPLNQE